MDDENQLIRLRKQKLEDLKKLGINPYSYRYDKKDYASHLLDEFKKLGKEGKSSKKIKIAGRIISLRPMGKIAFGHLLDATGKIQFYAKEDELGKNEYKIFSKFDIGDIIGIEGSVFRTK